MDEADSVQGDVLMSLAVAVLKEQAEGERRVALDPASANKLASKGFQVLIEKGAGDTAGFSDEQYSDCIVLDDPEIILTMADIWLWVQVPATEQLANLPDGRLGMGLVYAHRNPAVIDTLKQHRLTCMAMELVPQSIRSQPMDVLSSQATVAGYKAVLRAATLAPRLFPMLTTAAGVLKPARVIIIGADVAGLQAIATARRLGARVEVYVTDADAQEQVESLGAKIIDARLSAEDEDGNTRELTEEEKQQQTGKLAEHLAKADVVISTVTIPVGPAPKIITETMVEGMNPGSVIIDLAAESGGNCVLTNPGTTVVRNGVFVDGPLDLASEAATHASEMYAHNLLSLLELLVEGENLKIDREDEVVDGTLLTFEGELVHETTAELLPLNTANDSRGF
jgi:NAD(P) transhydrogenase subunit alpha